MCVLYIMKSWHPFEENSCYSFVFTPLISVQNPWNIYKLSINIWLQWPWIWRKSLKAFLRYRIHRIGGPSDLWPPKSIQDHPWIQVDLYTKFEESTSRRFRDIMFSNMKQTNVTSQWPWPLTFDRQNLISSSLSHSEHLCKDLPRPRYFLTVWGFLLWLTQSETRNGSFFDFFDFVQRKKEKKREEKKMKWPAGVVLCEPPHQYVYVCTLNVSKNE